MAAIRHLGFVKFNFALAYQISYRSVKPLRRYRDFCDFQDGGRRHLGFWKIRNFNGLSPAGVQSASPCQISFKKTVKRLLRYSDITVFKMAAVRLVEFQKFKFLTVWAVKGLILHNRAKFREDRSIRWCDIAIFVIFKLAAADIGAVYKRTFSFLLLSFVSGSFIFRLFSAERNCRKSASKLAVLGVKGSKSFKYWFRHPERHILARKRLFRRILL